ncbi:MAG: hypothetical protein AB1522_02650 [Chloroflexota bacterium]
MDETFLLERSRYDEQRKLIIQQNLSEPNKQAQVESQWEAYDKVVYGLTSYFGLLPQYTACVVDAAWELATYTFLLSRKLFPRDISDIEHWALKFWERIIEKCRTPPLDISVWHKLAVELWTPLIQALPSQEEATSKKPTPPDEKKRLEAAVVEEFLPQFNEITHSTYSLLEIEGHERPDALLEDSTGTRLGLEITHVYHDDQEAKILLGRSHTEFSGLQSFNGLLDVLQSRIRKKQKDANSYPCPYPLLLLVRVVSPVFTWRDFQDALRNGRIQLQPSAFKEVWLLARDEENLNSFKALKLTT